MKAVDDMTLKAVFVRAFNKFYANREQFLSSFMKNVERGLENKSSQNLEIETQIQSIIEDIKKLIRLHIQ